MVGDNLVTFDGGKVRAYDGGQKEPRWTADAPADTHLEWLAADSKTVYLAPFRVDSQKEVRPQSPPRVRRLELATGKWLEELPYVLAVTGLRAENGRLRVTLGMEDWARTLEFDVAAPTKLDRK